MFDNIKHYVDDRLLPNFSKILSDSKLVETYSEKKYHELEPWIQWVTVHTGKKFADHNIFRLGDFRNSNLKQIWEKFEDKKLKCLAVSPMNAKNNLSNNSIFIPDPWSDQKVNGNWLDRRTYESISNLVNKNSGNRFGIIDLLILGFSALSLMDPKLIYRILKTLITYRGKSWSKAIVLDIFLSRLTLNKIKAHKPHYTSLFLNAGAHIQHHYLFSSESYKGSQQNPKWYDDAKFDPLFAIYSEYDKIIGDFLKLDSKINIITGLSQTENHSVIYYYRPIDHAKFLEAFNIKFKKVEARMSRDFLVTFNNQEEKDTSINILNEIKIKDQPLLELDVRKSDVFCKVDYKNLIDEEDKITFGEKVFSANDLLVHVSIENSIHQSKGYFIDVNNKKLSDEIRLEELFDYQLNN